jgi:hypothetical protein
MNHRQARVFTVLTVLVATISIGLWDDAAQAQPANSIPQNKAAMGTFPDVNDLPIHKEMPEVLTMNDGTRVVTVEQWHQRREEMKANS